MPPKGDPLTPAQIGILRAWIDQGAPWPEEGPAIATREDAWRTHWAFQPLARPVVPPGGARPAPKFIARPAPGIFDKLKRVFWQ